jgi:hypothetical protein
LSIDIQKEKANRLRFVKLLYEKTGGDEYKWVNMRDLGKELGFDGESIQRITQYLNGEHLLTFQALGGVIGITHWGVKEMEQALSNPNQPTMHFPAAVNILHIAGDVVGSQIQQGTEASQQIQITQDTQLALTEFLSSLEKDLTEIKAEANTLRDLKADIQTIKAQLGAAQPKRSIVREALSSIRSILEAAGATLLAAEAAKILIHLL